MCVKLEVGSRAVDLEVMRDLSTKAATAKRIELELEVDRAGANVGRQAVRSAAPPDRAQKASSQLLLSRIAHRMRPTIE